MLSLTNWQSQASVTQEYYEKRKRTHRSLQCHPYLCVFAIHSGGEGLIQLAWGTADGGHRLA